MVTHVSFYRSLHPMMLLGPSAPNRYPTKVATGLTRAFVNMATWDLYRGRRSHHPFRLQKARIGL
jgi:hypothetical protein